jgi:hypothetical protein
MSEGIFDRKRTVSRCTSTVDDSYAALRHLLRVLATRVQEQDDRCNNPQKMYAGGPFQPPQLTDITKGYVLTALSVFLPIQ